MADGAVIGDALSILCVVTSVVAAEASGIGVVTEVVWMRPPADLHEGKYIVTIDHGESLRGLIDLRALPGPDSLDGRQPE